MRGRLTLALAAALLPVPALAGNIAKCEAVISAFVEDENGGGADISSFRDPTDFFMGIYDEDTEPVTEIGGFPIRAIICERRDLMPDEDDYAILASGVMLSLSQAFDSKQSDMLTVKWIDGRFRWQWKSADPIDPDMRDALVERLADFSARDHGLGEYVPADAQVDEAPEDDPAEGTPAENDLESDTPTE